MPTDGSVGTKAMVVKWLLLQRFVTLLPESKSALSVGLTLLSMSISKPMLINWRPLGHQTGLNKEAHYYLWNHEQGTKLSES